MVPSSRLPVKLFAFFIVVIGIVATVLLLPGHLAVSGHEVDVLHAVEAAMRLSFGQAQHFDFLTPLGVLAFEPIALFLRLGFGISTANIGASILMALLFLPFLLWVAVTRFDNWLGGAFGALTLTMVLAIVYGGDNPAISMSMHYNRWGWAATFVILAILIFPSNGEQSKSRVDGAVIGLLLGYLLLLKATYFVALAPAVALLFVTGRNWSALTFCLIFGALMCLLATITFGGFEFWKVYISDLVRVTTANIRPNPGDEFVEVLALPQYFPGTMCLLAAIVGFRTSGHSRLGFALFVLAPGLVYITYQNWGNDTKWLLPLGFACLLWSTRMEGLKVYGWDGKTYFIALGIAALTLVAPSFINMASSPVRNLAISADEYVSLLHDPRHAGLLIDRERSYHGDATIKIEGLTDPNPVGEDDVEPLENLRLGDFEIAECTLKTGYYGVMKLIADDIIAAGYGDAKFAFIDVANPLPLLAPLQRLEYTSPWYYGGAQDVEEAEILVVPKCPVSAVTFRAYLEALNASDTAWELSDTRDHFWIFKRS